MKEFKQLGIKAEDKGFVGDKIEIHNILNEKITVLDYRITNSNYQKKGDEKCLHLQIELNSSKRVVFTGSSVLMEIIQKVPKEDFPFTTIVKKNNKRFEFT